MNDIIEMTTELTYINPTLQKFTNKVIKLGNAIRNNLYEVAFIIAEVDASECYKDDGFNNVAEWGEKSFGFKKTAIYDLLKIGRDYTRARLSAKGNVVGYESNLLPENVGEDFTTTQIIKMLPAGRELVVELVDNEEITPEMSCREIGKVIKAHTKTEEKKEDNDNTEGDNTENGEDNTPANEEVRDVEYFLIQYSALAKTASEELTEDEYKEFLNKVREISEV